MIGHQDWVKVIGHGDWIREGGKAEVDDINPL